MHKYKYKKIILALLFVLIALPTVMIAQTRSVRYMVVTENDGNITVFNFNEVQSVTWAKQEPLPGSIGVAKATINGTNTKVKWIQLWEGGPKFAEYNVGVTDGKIESTGGYYAWGGNQDKVDDYNTDPFDLTRDTDTANKLWGDNWRMPSQTELLGLLDNCTVEWTTVNGVNGRLFTGKGVYACNSVFFPAVGHWENNGITGYGDKGFYWSSTRLYRMSSHYLYFESDKLENSAAYVTNINYSVRAIYDPKPLAPGSYGQGKAKINGSEVDVTWIQLWEEGPKFAEYNVGVTDGKAESEGGYYCWGKSIDKDPNHAKGGAHSLTGNEDTATNLWGSDWRMPSETELQELFDNCTVEWTNDYKEDGTNISGIIVTGKRDYSSNKIFLPAAGSWEPKNQIEYQGTQGAYWTSTCKDNLDLPYLSFNKTGADIGRAYQPYVKEGYSVRAIYDPELPYTGKAKAKINGSEVDVKWIQLWENGPKFAEYNVGVTNGKPESYGGYYRWSGHIDKDTNKYYTNTSQYPLSGSDDTATNLWGNNWRMPRNDELRKLLEKCDVEWTTVRGVKGYKFTGKGEYSANSVFLPAGGYFDTDVIGQGDLGRYWSSYPEDHYLVYYLNFSSDTLKVDTTQDRKHGFLVRSVLK